VKLQEIENAVIGLALGAVPVISGFLAGWWISLPLVPESRIHQFALAGLVLGILVDVRFLRGWVQRAYSLKPWLWRAVYVFYSVGMLGLFMGVPVFNVALALPAGVFVGRWLVHCDADSARVRRTARETALFTTSILGLVCLASASIALASPSTAADLQGMLRLPFPVTRAMILGMIVGGGLLLLALNWWLSVRSVALSHSHFRQRSNQSLTDG